MTILQWSCPGNRSLVRVARDGLGTMLPPRTGPGTFTFVELVRVAPHARVARREMLPALTRVHIAQSVSWRAEKYATQLLWDS